MLTLSMLAMLAMLAIAITEWHGYKAARNASNARNKCRAYALLSHARYCLSRADRMPRLMPCHAWYVAEAREHIKRARLLMVEK